ncbi:hypothetical protein A6F49_07995 [Enteractinococcus helveticum]|uniref:DUF1345 domain-containing protein n=1 Tax=Enteractinococcus helveticum TaxID=1837282 RepID=A0A1B7M0S0_9MICC|nr:hypothetical protein A6F49_07995 [Enteractinococcus helveticum]
MSVRTTIQTWTRRALDSDNGRITLVALFSFLMFFPLSFPLNTMVTDRFSDMLRPDGISPLFVVIYMGVYWFIYTVFYCAITIWWFSRLASVPFHEKLRTTSRGVHERRKLSTAVIRSDGTMSISLQMSLLALVFTVVVMTVPDFRGEFMMKVIALLVSFSNWVAVVVTQTLAYARVQAQDIGGAAVRFAGTTDAVWGDYFSLALGISTMLGPADAQLKGRRVRTTVRWHALVSFAFNSMVIASLATLMLST